VSEASARPGAHENGRSEDPVSAARESLGSLGAAPSRPGGDPTSIVQQPSAAYGAERDSVDNPRDPIATPATRAGLVNVANLLTVSRMAFVPLFVWLLFTDGTWWRLAALVVFAAASATDRFDGQLARSRNLVTDFGKIADPIADKALIGSARVGLSLLGELWWWATVVILVREIGITVLRFVVIRYGVMAASRGGKLKTMLQVIAIGLYVTPGPLDPLRWAAMSAATLVTVVTGLDYVLKAWRLWRDGRAIRRDERSERPSQSE
jgi:CDP-diacylglycerol---glycerol-3-phosphate 3-phosphatidyltransferase